MLVGVINWLLGCASGCGIVYRLLRKSLELIATVITHTYIIVCSNRCCVSVVIA